ncbi:MAG TPA: TRAP transporter substrate-binding protein [Desulfobacteraceae bacterium]|nr:TRAP transporter substrate-binding protein [Desulfobacteraceae bacterium]HPJ67702.1 TRAP transporter substrate-binding protein [Desulfobacteraceae bacterium]HPQ29415.1 TRAP transporter substrate-binding protein [Desulfobacteraceae bacterium]
MKKIANVKIGVIGPLLGITIMALALFCFLLPVTAVAGDTITMTYSGFMPPTHSQSKVEAAWCKEVEKRTNGRVKIIHYPGQTLTQATQNYQGVKAGLSDLGCSVLQYTRGRFPLMDFINLPLGYPSGQVATALINEVYDKFKPKELDEVKVLYFHAHGPGFIHTKGKAVHTMEDLKGLKIRSHGPTATMIQCLGGTPTAFPMNELYQSLQKGVVQGGIYPLESNKGWKMAEVTDYVIACYPTAYSLGFYIVMNKDKWNALPDEDKKIIEEINSEWIFKHGKAWETAAFEGISFLLQHGNSMIGIGPKEANRWTEAVKPVLQNYIDETEKQGLPGKEVLAYVSSRLDDFQKGKFNSKYMEK